MNRVHLWHPTRGQRFTVCHIIDVARLKCPGDRYYGDRLTEDPKQVRGCTHCLAYVRSRGLSS